MITISRDEKCDLEVTPTGQLRTVEGIDAYAQIINAKMRTVRGECELNLDAGLPYFDTIFMSPRNRDIWMSEARSMIGELPFVISIKSFETEFTDNTLYYIMQVITDLGEVYLKGLENDNKFKGA